MTIGEIMSQYSEKNINDYEPVSVGKLGIRLRSDVFGRQLNTDNKKNKVIYKNTLTIGMGSKTIDYSVLHHDKYYSVSPDYKTFNISYKINSYYWDMYFKVIADKLFYLYAKENTRNGRRIDIDSLLKHKVTIIENNSWIGNYLSQIDNLINFKGMSISKLKTHINYIRNNMMFNTDNKSIRLSDIATITGGYAFKSKDMIEQKNENRILRIGDIKPSISESNFTGKYYHSDNLKNIPIASINQLVIALSGATFGKVGIVQDGIFLLNQRTAVITSISQQIIINQLLQTDHFKNYIQSIPSASAQPNISTLDLEVYSFSPSNNYYKTSIFLSQMDNFTKHHLYNGKLKIVKKITPLYILFLHIIC